LVNVMFTVKTDELEERKSTPTELVLVLDKSGSMIGDKLRFSKTAIRNIIESLTENDILHLVTYDSDVNVVFEGKTMADKELMLKLVNEVEAGGATFLSGGLLRGHEVIQQQNRKRDEASSFRTKRIFLFSDGQANHGISDPEQLATLVGNVFEDGVRVSSFGVGYDYDEQLMKALSFHGGGDYYFIDSPEILPRVLQHARDGLSLISGQSAVLKVRGKTEGRSIVKQAFDQEMEALISGIKVGDLLYGDSKQFLVEVEVEPLVEPGSDVVILEWVLTWNDKQGEPQQLSGEVGVKATDDEKVVEESRNKEVEDLKLVFEYLEMEKEVKRHIENGDLEEALEAETIVNQQWQTLDANNPTVAYFQKNSFATMDTLSKKDRRAALKYHPDSSGTSSFSSYKLSLEKDR